MRRRGIWILGLAAALWLAAPGAALAQCGGSIGDFIFHDVNGNGLQDGPDLGLAGVTARLTDSAGNVMEVTSTEFAGYGFFDLCAGEYTLEIASVPAGFVPTATDVGSDDSVDSDPSPISVVLPDDFITEDRIDFGFVEGEEEGCGLVLDAGVYSDTVKTGGWLCRDRALAIYRYRLENRGEQPIFFTTLTDDQLGFVGFQWRLDPGRSSVRYWLACLAESTTSHVRATGWVDRGEKCTASDSVSITVID